jgi:hypothetical protein
MSDVIGKRALLEASMAAFARALADLPVRERLTLLADLRPTLDALAQQAALGDEVLERPDTLPLLERLEALQGEGVDVRQMWLGRLAGMPEQEREAVFEGLDEDERDAARALVDRLRRGG